MRAPFYPIMAENKGFILTNNRLSHQSGIRKASVGKTLYLIPFLLFWSEKKKKKKKTSHSSPTSNNAITTGSATVNFNPSPFLSHGMGLSLWFH
jgi:hypothetical protein